MEKNLFTKTARLSLIAIMFIIIASFVNFNFGVSFAYAQKNPKNNFLSIKFLTNLCDKGGNAKQCTFLGYMYATGKGVLRNYSLAVKYYQKACGEGFGAGCYGIGYMYATGAGVSRNYSIAAKYYQIACAKGFASGCQNLGGLYYLTKNYATAYKYFLLACHKGIADGCYNVGYMYFKGLGAPRNYSLAYKYFLVSCNSGSSSGCYMAKAMSQ